jgi:hypothetical protein
LCFTTQASSKSTVRCDSAKNGVVGMNCYTDEEYRAWRLVYLWLKAKKEKIVCLWINARKVGLKIQPFSVLDIEEIELITNISSRSLSGSEALNIQTYIPKEELELAQLALELQNA